MENLLKELNNILDEAEIKANKIKQLAEERKFKLQKVLDKIDPLADSLWDEIEKLYAENDTANDTGGAHIRLYTSHLHF